MCHGTLSRFKCRCLLVSEKVGSCDWCERCEENGRETQDCDLACDPDNTDTNLGYSCVCVRMSITETAALKASKHVCNVSTPGENNLVVESRISLLFSAQNKYCINTNMTTIRAITVRILSVLLLVH